MALRWGSTETKGVDVPWECEGCANVGSANLPNSPWPPSRRLFNSLGPQVSGDALRCRLVSQGTMERATDIAAGIQTRLSSQLEKTGTQG